MSAFSPTFSAASAGISNKPEIHQSSDVEKNTSSNKILCTLNDESPSSNLEMIGDTNPYYSHDLLWTEQEESQIVRTFDLKVLTWVGVMFFFQSLDRSIVSYALTDNLMKDLGININTVTLSVTLFTAFFIALGEWLFYKKAAWIAENTAPAGKRSISIAMYIMSANLCAFPGVNIFRGEWSPRYIPTMWILAGCEKAALMLFLFQRFHLAWHNKRRVEITKSWTEADWDHYNATTTDYGDERLDFRYKY